MYKTYKCIKKNFIQFHSKYRDGTTYETLLLLNLYQKLVTNLLISNIFSRDPIPIDNCK